MLQLLFLTLSFVILFLIIIIILPYHYYLSFNYSNNFNFKFRVSFLFFKIIFNFSGDKKVFYLKIFNYKKSFIIKNYKKPVKKAANTIWPKLKEHDFNSSDDQSNLSKELNIEILSHFFSFLKSIINEIKPKNCKLHLVIAFADPYYNALVLAYYYLLEGILNFSDFKVETNWQKSVFKAAGRISGQIIPIRIMFVLLKFIFSIKTIKFFWQLYKSNKKG